jgi:uncharacterized membrane protein HdeD (DUF308 family)
MFIKLSRNWWWLALRGITIILFGIIALAWRGDTLGSFMLLFGGLALVDGLLTILLALTDVAENKRGWILVQGSVSVALAVISFIWTESAATILLYLVAAWALITGLLELVGGWELRQNISNQRLLILSGLASILFGWLVIHFSVAITDVSNLAGMIAAFAIIFGLLTLAMSLNLRSLGKYIHSVHRS